MMQRGRPSEERGSARACDWTHRGDPVLNSLNPWAEIPEDCGAQPFPPRRESCLSPSSCFSSLEASVKCFCNKMVLCQAL